MKTPQDNTTQRKEVTTMGRTAMVTRNSTTKHYKVTYVTKAREFVEVNLNTSKGEDIAKVAENNKPNDAMVFSIEQVGEDIGIFGIPAVKFFELAEPVNNRRGLITKEYTHTTYKVTYVTKAREFIDREVMISEYEDINERANDGSYDGMVFAIEKIGEPVKTVVGMTYDKFMQYAEPVKR